MLKSITLTQVNSRRQLPLTAGPSPRMTDDGRPPEGGGAGLAWTYYGSNMKMEQAEGNDAKPDVVPSPPKPG